MPTRRHTVFGLTAAATALACPFVAAPAHAASLSGRAGALAPAGSTGDEWWQRLIRRLDSADNGSIDMDYLIRGEIGNEEVVLSGLLRNRVQMAGASDWASSSVVPEVGVINLPYLFDSEDEFNFVYDNYALPPLRAAFERRGLVLVQSVNIGFANLYADRPVRVPADVEGVALRAPLAPGVERFLRAVGADPIQLGVADVNAALQTGLVKGGIATTVMHLPLTARAEQAKYYTLTEHSYSLTLLIANKRWLGRANAAQREAILAGFDAIETIRAENREEQRTAMAEIRDEIGVEVIALTLEERAAWREASIGTHDELLAEYGGQSTELYQEIQRGKAAFAAR